MRYANNDFKFLFETHFDILNFQDNILPGLVHDIAARFKDILNCELAFYESDESQELTSKDMVGFQD
jgi:hypothetical protein